MYHFYLLIFFIRIFLACDILEKKKKRKARIGIKRRWFGKKLTPTCFGLPSEKSVTTSMEKGEFCIIISIFSQPLVVIFQE